MSARQTPRLKRKTGRPLPPSQALQDLIELVRFLRSPRGCPWDRRQTRETLAPYLLEEVYEFLEALERGEEAAIAEELGDLFLHLVFQLLIAEEGGTATLDGISRQVVEKMERRHPHLFGHPRSPAEPEPWEGRKRRERSSRSNLPRALPSLLKACRLLDRFATFPLDWTSPSGALAKVREEVKEVERALTAGRPGAVEEELGDLLFATLNLCSSLEIHPEPLLARAVRKFAGRLAILEREVQRRGKLSPKQARAIWEGTKRLEVKTPKRTKRSKDRL